MDEYASYNDHKSTGYFLYGIKISPITDTVFSDRSHKYFYIVYKGFGLPFQIMRFRINH